MKAYEFCDKVMDFKNFVSSVSCIARPPNGKVSSRLLLGMVDASFGKFTRMDLSNECWYNSVD